MQKVKVKPLTTRALTLSDGSQERGCGDPVVGEAVGESEDGKQAWAFHSQGLLAAHIDTLGVGQLVLILHRLLQLLLGSRGKAIVVEDRNLLEG